MATSSAKTDGTPPLSMSDLFGQPEPKAKRPAKKPPITKKEAEFPSFDLSSTRPYRIVRQSETPHITWIINTDTP